MTRENVPTRENVRTMCIYLNCESESDMMSKVDRV